MEHKYFLYVCESEGQLILYSILFGYKGVLQALALLLAFRTRHVKVKGLHDSVYIAASIYVTSIVLAVIIVSTYTLRDYVNAHPAVVGLGLLLGTTMILALVFLPISLASKVSMIFLYISSFLGQCHTTISNLTINFAPILQLCDMTVATTA